MFPLLFIDKAENMKGGIFVEFTLNIYGTDDEIIKTYSTAHVRWGIFADAIKLQEEIKDKTVEDQLAAVGSFIKNIFVGLTDEELRLADAFDVFNTFRMIVSKAKGITGGSAKNG